jgi:hypothetical protein
LVRENQVDWNLLPRRKVGFRREDIMSSLNYDLQAVLRKSRAAVSRVRNYMLGDPWMAKYTQLREPKTEEDLSLDEASILSQLHSSVLSVKESPVPVQLYQEWMKRANYVRHNPGYYPDNLHEKSLEHFFAAHLLELRSGQVFIDIASQSGTAAEIYTRLYQVQPYLQDLDYPAGINGNRIGGSAASMPIPDNFADAMTLHCSFEHFEGDADTGFVREAAREMCRGPIVPVP